jgi:transcriptional regulator with XRE-family HTH domain
MISKQEIGARLRKARKARRISVKETAYTEGVTPYAIHAWERGAHDPGLERVQSLCETYGISVSSLFTVNGQSVDM